MKSQTVYGYRPPVGTEFGKLKIVEYLPGLPTRCRCACACGNECNFDLRLLKVGDRKSCGCLSKTNRLLTKVGDTFGNLTVLEHLADKIPKCLCSCTCGKKVVIVLKNLRKGNSQSCGCLRRYRALNTLKIGDVFGHLTLTEKLLNGYCRCRCSCGKETIELASKLAHGKRTSCGCLRKNTAAAINQKPIIPGTVYGRLTVLETRAPYATCRCTDGKIVTVYACHLRSGHTQSCGCLQREMASKNAQIPIAPGKRFYELTVLRQEGDKCLCRCSCHRELHVLTKLLTSGRTKSCGCSQYKKREFGTGTGALNARYCVYRSNAEHHKRIFALSRQQFRNISVLPCAYCREPPKQIARSGHSQQLISGIERIDSTEGYTSENCVPCCTSCKRAKGRLNSKEFASWIAALAQPKEIKALGAALPDNAATRLLYSNYSSNAKAKNVAFDIEFSHFLLTTAQNCHYCGSPPNRETRYGKSHICYNGLDRIDSTIGYAECNSVACCWNCSNGKGSKTVMDFRAWALKVSNFTSATAAVYSASSDHPCLPVSTTE